MLTGLRTLILNPHNGERTRLRQVFASIVYQGRCDMDKSLLESSSRISSGMRYDLVIASSRLPHHDLVRFLSDVQAAHTRQRCLNFIALAPEHVTGSSAAALYRAIPVEGFIFEPLVACQVEELFNTASAAPPVSIPQEDRDIAAAGILIAEAVQSIDSVATTMARGKGVGPGYRELQRVNEQLDKVEESLPREELERILLRRFADARIPRNYRPRKIQSESRQKIEHPGAVIRGLITARGISIEKLQNALGLEGQTLAAILEGKAGIDQDIAKNLAHLLGNTDRYWMNMQERFTTQQSRQKGNVDAHLGVTLLPEPR